ncbi:hypothetical protein BK674_14630 [Pseudomonas moraviensis]|uniref:Glycosyltransferase RgtA/B/C/D-like domain-containing protein n=1 Tax=Pseudomonas moraviensis TaxID=321662 RepID=A0A423NPY6_9PSED|nr:hypothetical protein [Pseudomonas moraviensis]ROO00269.1 hypothetical protein BK674_14630 [Pseudomonas moraviensis]
MRRTIKINRATPSCAASSYCDTYRAWLAHIAPAALIVLFIWLPFGFSLTGLLEEWGVIGLFSRIGVFFLADASSAMPAHALRPLTVFPHAIGYSLDPASFNYWHILLIVALVLKGMAASMLITRITGALKWGMLASVLIIVFPADTMQLSFRSIHINWALSLTLMASALLLYALDQKHKTRSVILSMLASLVLGAACAMYEVALLLAATPPLIAFARNGTSGLVAQLKAFYAQYLIWAAAPVAYIIYVIYTLPQVHSYQSAVVGDSALTSFKTFFPKIFSLGLARSVLGGWIDAWNITYFEIGSYWYLAIATGTLLGLIALFARDSQALAFSESQMRLKWRLPARMIAVGFMLVCLGYVPFIFNPAHMAVSQRTFLYAAPGATLAWLAVLLILYRYSKITTGIVAAVLVFTGLGAQLFQYQHYLDISKRQQSALNDIAQNFDGNALNKTILILDYRNELNHDWMFLNPDLSALLFHLYGKPVDIVEICYMPSHEWQQSDPLQRKGRCEETEEGWTLHYPSPLDSQAPASKKLAKTEVITVAVGNGLTMPASAELQTWREQLASSASDTGVRLRGITEAHPWFDFLRFRNRDKDEYYWDFGRWWSMAIPMAGSGWRNTEWRTRRTAHIASAWINAPRASIVFDLVPKPDPYTITGLFSAFANANIRSEMEIRVNGHSVPVEWSANGEFSGSVPPTALQAGRNSIEFLSSVDPAQGGVSARLDWVKVARQPLE